MSDLMLVEFKEGQVGQQAHPCIIIRHQVRIIVRPCLHPVVSLGIHFTKTGVVFVFCCGNVINETNLFNLYCCLFCCCFLFKKKKRKELFKTSFLNIPRSTTHGNTREKGLLFLMTQILDRARLLN